MPALRASVIIIDHPNTEVVAFGADFSSSGQDFAEARTAISEFEYPVVVLPSSQKTIDKVLQFLDCLNQVSPLSQRVIIKNDTTPDNLRRIVNSGSVFRILGAYTDSNFDLTIQEALDEYRLLQQNTKLLQLVNEQNERLKRLTSELEERVEVRRRSLEDAKEKLLATNQRVEALHRALVAIHRAGSIAEMERLVNEALRGALGLMWTRILFQSQGRLDMQADFSRKLFALNSAPLMRGKETYGHIYFARGAEHPFNRDEINFLGQIGDAVSLAIDRLTKLEETESLKHQWEATFDAILEPVSLIDSTLTVVRINRSFAHQSGTEPEKVIGRKCYEALFGRSSQCEGCQLGNPTSTNFRLPPSRTVAGQHTIYDVFSQEIQLKPEDQVLYVNMYHDISAQLRYERQILESAKMAELGTIGSSIAHELNNPLAGMLSYLQLIKMGLSGDEPWFTDIEEMEKGARRCRDIVQSLLGFTRKSSHDPSETIDLREVLEQALKITELQTRAIGIKVTSHVPPHAIEVRGQFNALAQAIRNFLQAAQETIAHRLRSKARHTGEIHIHVSSSESHEFIEITDNGDGFECQDQPGNYEPLFISDTGINNTGLGLSVAQQIIADHGGTVEITSTKGLGTSAKISIPRLVFDS